jgi:hypothetical protein
MAEGELTSRQGGGAHMWTKAEADATAAAGGMTRSVVRRSYQRPRARAQGRRARARAYVPVATAVNAQFRPWLSREAQFRPTCP